MKGRRIERKEWVEKNRDGKEKGGGGVGGGVGVGEDKDKDKEG